MTITLQHADCMDFLKQQATASVDLIVTDPPYFRFLSTAWDRQWRTVSEYLSWLEAVLVEYQRVLKPAGSLYVFASPRMASKVEHIISQHFNVLTHINWFKKSGPHNKACKAVLRQYHAQTERILFAEQNTAAQRWHAVDKQLKQSVFEPLRVYFKQAKADSGISNAELESTFGSKYGHWFSQSQWTMPGQDDYQQLQRLFKDALKHRYSDINAQYETLKQHYLQQRDAAQAQHRRYFHLTKNMPFTDVWDFKPTPARAGRHPCEKPLPLIKHIIEASSREGDVVLDTFAGSGSTAVACMQLNRSFVGCELGEKEYQQAVERIKHTQEH